MDYVVTTWRSFVAGVYVYVFAVSTLPKVKGNAVDVVVDSCDLAHGGVQKTTFLSWRSA